MRRIMYKGLWIAILLLLLDCQTAQGKEVVLEPADSIQQAVDQAEEGDILILKEGIYSGSISIRKSLVIQGEDGVVIEGDKKGNVITIEADQVEIRKLYIKGSGKEKKDSGIFIDKGKGHVVEENIIAEVQNGIYVNDGKEHTLRNNSMTSYSGHFSERGSGIHLYKGSGHTVEGNYMSGVQDGLYLDSTTDITVFDNKAAGSRYGFHFMFSEDLKVERNEITRNVTGMMIMDSAGVKLRENEITEQFHVRGFGIILYDSDDLVLTNNELKGNSTGLSMEKTRNAKIMRNSISGNQVGLEFIGENKNNVFSENNFIGNVVQSKIANSSMRLDDGESGNYWDDYSSFDITGDGYGEITYKAGSLYDQLLEREPYWQLFFESPSIELWSKVESLFPSIGAADVYDEKPLVEPVDLEDQDRGGERNVGILLMAVPLLWFSTMIIWLGRRSM